MITDTHTHLYNSEFDKDRDQVIQRALKAGVSNFFLPAIDSKSTKHMLDLERAYPKLMQAMIGVHPTSINDNYKEELEHVKQWINKRFFCAIGEIGIDLYWDKKFIKEQQKAFDIQIKWARDKNIPIVIHCRDAFDEVFEILQGFKDKKLYGIFHCFTGTLEQAKKALSFNMKLGIGGIVTFKNGNVNRFLNEIPLEDIVLETDSPYLAPVPHRGKRNEPSFLPLIVEKLTNIYGLPYKTIVEQTTKNALAIFESPTKRA